MISCPHQGGKSVGNGILIGAPDFLGRAPENFKNSEKNFFQRRVSKCVPGIAFKPSVSYLMENFDSGPRIGLGAPKWVKIFKFLFFNIGRSNFVSVKIIRS